LCQRNLSLTHPLQAEILNAIEAMDEFSPAIAIFITVDAQKRVQELQGYLDPKNHTFNPNNRTPISNAAIKLYKDGKMDGVEQVFIMDRKVVPEKETETEILGAGMRQYGISFLPKSMLMVMDLW
jgi:hypothetical protein